MNNRYLVVSLCALLAVAGCAKNTPPGAANANAVAIVNGKPVDAATFDVYLAAAIRKPAGEATPEQRAQLLDRYIAMQLAAESAVKKGMDKKPEVAALLGLARTNVLSEAVFRQYLQDHPITDAEIKAEYDLRVAGMGLQYNVRHIVVESKSAADELIKRLVGGADFARLAQRESKDPTASKGGEIGWVSLESMRDVPALRIAISSLTKGAYTREPVQTQFGWHILKLEDTRPPTPPDFETAKNEVRGLVQTKKLQAYVDELTASAKIEKTASTSSTPATTSTATPMQAPAPKP